MFDPYRKERILEKELDENGSNKQDNGYKKRIFIVDADFQYRFIRKIAVLAVCLVVVSLCSLAAGNYLYGNVEVSVVQPMSPIVSDLVGDHKEPTTILELLWPIMFICIVITLAATFLFGVIVSHRMAGPIYRIKRNLKKMDQGDLRGEIHLRTNDDFKSLAESVNVLTRKWRQQVRNINDIINNADSSDEDQKEDLILKLNAVLSSFKTE